MILKGNVDGPHLPSAPIFKRWPGRPKLNRWMVDKGRNDGRNDGSADGWSDGWDTGSPQVATDGMGLMDTIARIREVGVPSAEQRGRGGGGGPEGKGSHSMRSR